MNHKSGQIQSFSVLGKIIAPGKTSAVLIGYRAQAWIGDHLLTETITDGFGRFLLEWSAEVEQASFISVRIFAPWGDPAGEARLSPPELLYPSELKFSAVPEPRFFPQASEPATLPAPSSEMVSEEHLLLFQQAVAAAVEGGYLQDAEAGWVEQAIADLDRAHALARAGIQGDMRSLEMLRTLLQVEPRWEIPLGRMGDIGGWRPPLYDSGNCFVSPQDPPPLIWGAVMLDGLKGDFTWSERAAGFFNSRAEPINTAFNAAAAWAGGNITPRDFGGIVKSYDPTRFGQSWGRDIPQRPALSFCLSDRDVCLGALLFDLHQYGSQRVSDPPQVGSIVPDAVCEGYTGTVTLFPPAGSQFPASQPTDWGLAVDGKPIAIQNWDPIGAEVTIAFPANVQPGCQEIRWVHFLDPAFVTHLRDIGEQCAPFFGGAQGWMNFPYSVINRERGSNVSVVGTPQICRFTANSLTSLVIEACTDVQLEWEAVLPLCAGSSAQADVTLLADGNIRAAALSLKDHLVVNDEITTTFTLQVEALIGITRCTVAKQNMQVQRFKAIHLLAPGEVGCLDISDALPVTVRVSCPAPAGGIQVTLASSAPTRLAGGTVTIPEGSIEDFIELTIGQECGEVTITATTLGHQSDSFKRMISDIPQITAITPSEVDACQSFQLWLDGSCFGERIGQQEIFLVDNNGVPIQGKVLQVQANTRLLVEFPALESGQYPLAVTFCGKTGSAATLLKVKEKSPDIQKFSAMPSHIALCPTSIKLTWRVNSARRVRILRNGVVIPGSERVRSRDCGLWEELFDDPQIQFNNAQYTLEVFPGSGSPMKTAQAPVTAAPHTAFVGLAQQGGSTSFIYNNRSVSDPLAFCQAKNAVVTNVTNNSGSNLSLAHGGPGATFIVIDSGNSTSAFNGMPVEGNWTAQLGGNVGSLPSQITIKVDWASP